LFTLDILLQVFIPESTTIQVTAELFNIPHSTINPFLDVILQDAVSIGISKFSSR
jgi:hypothetical protein